MTLAESILIILLASPPFGNAPIIVSENTEDTVRIEVQDKVLIVDKDMKVLEVQGAENCKGEDI